MWIIQCDIFLVMGDKSSGVVPLNKHCGNLYPVYTGNKKMQHSCGVTYSIALSYQFQNFGKPIAITLNIILFEFNESRVDLCGHIIKLYIYIA